MRKWLAFLLAAMMLLSLVACGGDDGDDNSAPMTSQGDDSESSEHSSTPDESTPDETTTTVAGESTTTAGRTRSTTTTTKKGSTASKKGEPVKLLAADEKPTTHDVSILYNEMHSMSDPQAEAMKKAVLGAKDTVKPSTNGTTYYVSHKGNDENDGKSPATAWRTTARAGKASKQFKSGDVLLFERGGVYRGTVAVTSNMQVGAYGSGPKPQLYAGPCNIADAKYWQKTKYENVWKLNTAGMTDIGNIVFNHGEVCASTTRMFKEFLVTDSKNKPQDFYYYHNTSAGYVYMYYSKGNPGEDFDSIELAPNDSVITRLDNSNQVLAENIVIDNLCIRYAGAFGIVFKAAKNITVTNCEIGYIGGSLMDKAARYGNGIEFNSHVNGALIKNNWIYQCYDAGYTNQGWGAKHENLTIAENLIEYCPYNIEVYCDKNVKPGTGYIRDTVYEGNILRFAGYGFGTKNRYGSGDDNIANITGISDIFDAKGFVIRNNIMDTSYRFLVRFAYSDGIKGPKFEGNTWIQWDDTKSSVAQMRDSANLNHTNINMVQPAKDQKTMEASVAKYESNPKLVKFYSK